MLNFGLFAFTTPWILAALVLLPAIWWILRMIPPAPRRLRFPAIRFLQGLVSREETPRHTPPWLLALRLFLAALLILALAGPVMNPEAELRGDGPLVMVVDDGWAAAPGWSERHEAMRAHAERALREGREVVLVGTAPDPRRQTAVRMSAADAVSVIPNWTPRPWPVDRAAASRALAGLGLARGDVLWLSDGVIGTAEEAEAARALADELRALGRLHVLSGPDHDLALLLSPPETAGDRLELVLHRPLADGPRAVQLAAIGAAGEVLARQPLAFADDSREARLELELPLEMRNRIARIEVEAVEGAGGVVLFDERHRRRVVGLLGPGRDEAPQPLLSELYYVERALAPHADLSSGSLHELLDRQLSALVLADVAHIEPRDRARLQSWIEEGGVLLRFAGPRLAAGGDDLVPVNLREGDRHLGGALSWAQPLALASFAEDGPLAGLQVPADVVVSRQVLAQPGPGLAGRSWARLEDGTPLITGERRGEGWLVLIHTTANPAWSDFALSGSFVEVLRRLAALAPGVGGEARGTLAPIAVLDGFGRLVDPDAAVLPIEGDELAETRPGPEHPPGLYGTGRRDLDDEALGSRHALNLAAAVPALDALRPVDYGVAPELFAGSRELDLAPWLLTLAFLIALADMAIALALRGLLPWPGRAPAAAAAAAATFLLLVPIAAAAANDDDWLLAASNETRLAYVVTGIAEVDRVSEAGLYGLSRVLNRRTAVEAAQPLAIDVGIDELSLLTLLYWPVPPEHPELAPGTLERVDGYLRGGGMILFDTRDAGSRIPGAGGQGPGERRLAELLDGLNLPQLMTVPEDHALTRAFYLLQEFPGRFTGQTVWVDRPSPGVHDEVSSVIIGGHDWAGAWAVDDYGEAILPVVPGGESQREMARRFGVNLVMYALTGNYKTDQVHIPALLERLGQ